MIRFVFALVSLQLLFGCATNSISNVTKLSDGSSFLVVSSLGDTLGLHTIGTTVLDNEFREIDVSQWKVDFHLKKEASKLIEQSRYSVVPTEDQRGLPDLDGIHFSSEVQFKDVKDKVQAFAVANGAKVILVVHEALDGDPFYGTNQNINGYGYYRRTLFGMGETISYVHFGVTLYDANSMSRLVGKDNWVSVLSDISPEKATKEDLSSSEEVIKALLFHNLKSILSDLMVI